MLLSINQECTDFDHSNTSCARDTSLSPAQRTAATLRRRAVQPLWDDPAARDRRRVGLLGSPAVDGRCCSRFRDHPGWAAGAISCCGPVGPGVFGRSAQQTEFAGEVKMRCKGNSAAYVRRNTPLISRDSAAFMSYVQQEPRYTTSNVLDVDWSCGIIIQTICTLPLGDRGALEERQQTFEGPRAARRRHAEHATGKSRRFEVPRQRVLRPGRHGAGQVRDAAPRISRECVGRPYDRGIRCVAADILSGQDQLRGSGDRRPSAQEAWPARSTQSARRSRPSAKPPIPGLVQAGTGKATNPSQCSSLFKSKWPRANPFERASWPSRSGRNSISLYIQGRSSGQSR